MYMFSTDLTPVQVLFLKSPSKIKINEVIGTILRDLTIRRILNVTKIVSYPTERSKKPQKYFRFVKGEHYEGYEPYSFEKNIITAVVDAEQVQAKILTNYILRKYSMPSGFIAEKIYAPLQKDGYVSSLPILKAFGYYSLTSKGKTLVDEFTQFITQQETQLSALIDGDTDQFIKKLNETGAYIFFFEKYNAELYKKIISMVKRINQTKPLGINKDLSEYTEAISINMSYFAE